MATWIPDPDGLDAVLDKLAADIAGMYARAEQEMLRAIAVDIRANAVKPGSMETSVRLTQLRMAAQQIVAYLQRGMPGQVQQIIDAAAAGGMSAALQQMSVFAGVMDITQSGKWAVSSPAANLLAADLTSKLTEMHLRILRYPDDVYRQAVAKYASDTLFGAPSVETQQKVWQELLNRGVTGFTDSAGRNWNLATYSEMATRTATHRAWTDSHTDAMAAHGRDLVTVIVGRQGCKKCARYAGKILTTRGEPGVREVEHTTRDGVYLSVDVYDTVDNARANGLLHPNCRCRLVAYHPGLSIPADSTAYNPVEHKARNDLRALEVEVRKSKREALLAMSPAELRAAQLKTKSLQAQIREHVAEFDLQRARYREQMDLGFRNLAS